MREREERQIQTEGTRKKRRQSNRRDRESQKPKDETKINIRILLDFHNLISVLNWIKKQMLTKCNAPTERQAYLIQQYSLWGHARDPGNSRRIRPAGEEVRIM